MKTFSKKGVLLFAAAMALCAFAVPSMASASSSGPVPSHHTLDASSPVGFSFDALGVASDCARTQFTTRVVSTAVIEIDSASFSGCTATGHASGLGQCTTTPFATNLPWTMTAVTTSNIQIHGVDLDLHFENHPGSSACIANGLRLRITGTLTNAKWHGNGATRTIELLGSHGLVAHNGPISPTPMTLTGTLFDTQATLSVTN